MERTNVTDKGFTYNGQNFSKEARVDSQGQSYSVDVPNAISAQSLMGGQQAPIVPVTPNVPDISGLGDSASAYLTQESAASDIAAQNEITARKDYQKMSGNQASLQALLGGEAADLNRAYESSGATEAAAKMRQFASQSYALQSDNLRKTLREQDKATGQNITSTAVQRNIGDATRQNTIDIAGLAMQGALAKADYDTASNYAEKMVTAKYDKIKAEIEAAKTNLAALDRVSLTPAENRAKEARLAIVKKQDEENEKKKTAELRKYTEQIDNKKGINAIGLEIAKNGGDANLIKEAKTIGEAIQMGASGLKTESTEIVKLGDNAAYLIDKKTGRVIKSFGGGTGGGSGTLPKNSLYAPVISTILASGKFSKDQARAITNAITNGEDPATVIKNNARNIMRPDVAGKVEKNEEIKASMDDLKNVFNAYYAAGGKTSLIKGTMENVQAKMGGVNDPKLRELAIQVQTQLQSYRNAVSGTAYSNQEGQDIASVFPGINKSTQLNDAIFAGRDKALDSSIDNAYRVVLGGGYDQIKTVKQEEQKGTPKGNMKDSQYVEKVLSSQNIKYETVVNNTPQGQIPVVDNKTGETGYIPISEYNASLYTKI